MSHSHVSIYKKGDVINARYEIDALIGSGGMGYVYRARDLHFKKRERFVAVKVIHPDTNFTLEDLQEEAEMGMSLSAQLSEQQVHALVRVTDVGVTDDEHRRPFCVMELLYGVTLASENARRRMGDKPFTLAAVARIMISLAEALTCLHAIGYVHCDVKLDNIFLDQPKGSTDMLPDQPNKVRGWHVKLCDYGLMVFLEKLVKEPILRFRGAPRYVAREVFAMEPPTGATDMYALGLALYELLTGGVGPFDFPTPPSTWAEWKSAHSHQEVPAPSHVLRESYRRAKAAHRCPNGPSQCLKCPREKTIPAEWDALTLSMLRKDPRERSTARAVLEALLRIRAALSSGIADADALLARSPDGGLTYGDAMPSIERRSQNRVVGDSADAVTILPKEKVNSATGVAKTLDFGAGPPKPKASPLPLAVVAAEPFDPGTPSRNTTTPYPIPAYAHVEELARQNNVSRNVTSPYPMPLSVIAELAGARSTVSAHEEIASEGGHIVASRIIAVSQTAPMIASHAATTLDLVDDGESSRAPRSSSSTERPSSSTAAPAQAESASWRSQNTTSFVDSPFAEDEEYERPSPERRRIPIATYVPTASPPRTNSNTPVDATMNARSTEEPIRVPTIRRRLDRKALLLFWYGRGSYYVAAVLAVMLAGLVTYVTSMVIELRRGDAPHGTQANALEAEPARPPLAPVMNAPSVTQGGAVPTIGTMRPVSPAAMEIASRTEAAPPPSPTPSAKKASKVTTSTRRRPQDVSGSVDLRNAAIDPASASEPKSTNPPPGADPKRYNRYLDDEPTSKPKTAPAASSTIVPASTEIYQ